MEENASMTAIGGHAWTHISWRCLNVTDKCLPGFEEFNGYCYKQDTQELGYFAAIKECKNYPQGKLVSFHNQTEFEFVHSLTK